jgi:trigger factor
MSNVVRTDIDALNAVLTVTLTKDDYFGKVNQEIKKYSQKLQRPGFRPGKTPASFVKKLYGDSFITEVVHDLMAQKLNDYLEEAKPDIFGQPILTEQQAKIGFDPKSPKDIVFTFDIGLVPNIDIQGLDGVPYERYAVNVSDDKIDAEIENMRKRESQEIEVDTLIEDNDMVTLHIKEQGGTLEKVDLLVSMNWITDEMKEVFRTQKRGDQLTINLFQLENNTTPQYVRKYFLGLEETDEREVNENFDATIKFVKRQAKVEMNQEFFDKNFGEGAITSEAQMRDAIRQILGMNFQGQADALVERDIQKGVITSNNFDLPDSFLKRWLLTQDKKNTPESIEANIEAIKQSLRWNLIRSKIANTSNISISEEDLKVYYRARIRSYLGGMADNDEMIENLVEKTMGDEKQASDLYEEVLTAQVYAAMKSRVKIVNKPIDEAEFSSIIAAAQYEAAKARGEIKEEDDATISSEDIEVEEVEAEEIA